ncbi:oligosaccharide flippase family protein [Devosia sp. XJ19-1]|uniref:Oligosaccharide flippase family protein n=1 Tax=Devosia ureilytica TaxID=2952754 RepID=A0A9Q4ALE2_9HYPH|nr:oligosaccharide flippase family protein [Devosia ureilytica]MCP8881910.1 oligosaccharide flippase family protein [Devosia ureilytica]MCP8886204.1 oligosaccharide flippase family protein [Devosia ureilytica]
MHTDPDTSRGGLLNLVRHGVFWSIVQSWGGKIATFLLSVFLARLLSPEEFGIASSALLILLLVPMFAELGFGDAIMQRRRLQAADLNLPFYVSISAILVLFAIVVLMSGQISAWLGVPGFSLYIVVISATMLITVPTVFQEAVYKRNMRFRFLAIRTFITHILGGLLAVACAANGFGVWSFVVQAYVVAAISFIWLWRKPQWIPGTSIDLPAFFQMFRFGSSILGQRLLDFIGNRFVDLMIISQLGLTVYGIYAVGSRFYVTMMQMVQGALYDVSLTVLSSIATDRSRIAEVYLKTVSSAATYISPVFILIASIAPEICSVLFGERWEGVNNVAAPLLLLGSVQCVQYMNGAFLSARGRPDITLLAVLAKSVSPLILLLLVPSENVSDMVTLFVIGQLIAAPVSFYLVFRELGLKFSRILRVLGPAIINGIVCFTLVSLARPYFDPLGLHDFWKGIFIGAIYTLIWLTCLAIMDRARLISAVDVLLVSSRNP